MTFCEICGKPSTFMIYTGPKKGSVSDKTITYACNEHIRKLTNLPEEVSSESRGNCASK